VPAAVYDVKAGPEVGGAILTANARDSSMAAYGEATSFFACLMPYQGGYSLNVYTTFSKASGSFNAATLAATLARPLVGDTSQFIPRTLGHIGLRGAPEWSRTDVGGTTRDPCHSRMHCLQMTRVIQRPSRGHGHGNRWFEKPWISRV